MSLHISQLLVHDELVPANARAAIRIALAAPREEQEKSLAAAARVLYDETDIECSDALELVGLSEYQSGCA